MVAQALLLPMTAQSDDPIAADMPSGENFILRHDVLNVIIYNSPHTRLVPHNKQSINHLVVQLPTRTQTHRVENVAK